MSRNAVKAFFGVLGLSTILTIGLMANAEPKSDAKRPDFKPVMDVHQQMECQGGLFKQVKEGLLDKKWRPAADAAWMLTELGNINQYQHEDAQYIKFAKAMSDDCATLAKALKKKDEAAAKEALKLVGQRCGDCHDQFKK
ncbi:MAG: cytochrome c [Planctomycetes bacterium]|nr:cytochrome c [Planctomycetota bacterium]